MTKDEYISRLTECTGLNIIFQLTDKCVLSCRYCFAKGAHEDVPTFDTNILEEAIKQAFETKHEYVTFEWTGGEPLLVGLEFFKKVVEFQKKYATKPYENGIQTSGNLFDTKLIDYLMENNFGISTTIDGTEEIHNLNRPANGNKPSFQNVQKLRTYIEQKGGSCGFISTITKNNLKHEKEMLDFFQEQGVYSFHSNPYIYYSKNMVKDKEIALSNEDYARYFIAEFNAWVEKGKVKPIPRTINDIIKCLETRCPNHNTICTFGGRCVTNFIALTPNGDAYNCPKFTGSHNMILGNILKQPIKDIISPSSEAMNKFIDQRVAAINACEKKQCGYFYICNGGCPYYSFIASDGENVSEIDCLCEGKTLLYEYLDGVVNAIKETLPQ